jgi:hypothetical protein
VEWLRGSHNWFVWRRRRVYMFCLVFQTSGLMQGWNNANLIWVKWKSLCMLWCSDVEIDRVNMRVLEMVWTRAKLSASLEIGSASVCVPSPRAHLFHRPLSAPCHSPLVIHGPFTTQDTTTASCNPALLHVRSGARRWFSPLPQVIVDFYFILIFLKKKSRNESKTYF